MQSHNRFSTGFTRSQGQCFSDDDTQGKRNTLFIPHHKKYVHDSKTIRGHMSLTGTQIIKKGRTGKKKDFNRLLSFESSIELQRV
jgi:hypothetical protein